jgi:hypothetical protein
MSLPVEQTDFFHERTRPSGRRFTRTRPEATRFRQSRPPQSTAECLLALVDDLVLPDAGAEHWGAMLAAAQVGWNLAIMPTELDASWSDLPEAFRTVALEVTRRKMAAYPNDKAVIVGFEITEHEQLLEVSVTFVPYQ